MKFHENSDIYQQKYSSSRNSQKAKVTTKVATLNNPARPDSQNTTISNLVRLNVSCLKSLYVIRANIYRTNSLTNKTNLRGD